MKIFTNPPRYFWQIQFLLKWHIVGCGICSFHWRHDVYLWRHHDILQHLRNYLPELHGFCVESYVLGVKDFEKNSRHRDVYRDVMTWHRDVIMTFFNISGTICPNYMVFVLNPMF